MGVTSRRGRRAASHLCLPTDRPTGASGAWAESVEAETYLQRGAGRGPGRRLPGSRASL